MHRIGPKKLPKTEKEEDCCTGKGQRNLTEKEEECCTGKGQRNLTEKEEECCTGKDQRNLTEKEEDCCTWKDQRNCQRQRKRKTVAHGRSKEIAKDRERGKLLHREGPKKLPKTEKEENYCTGKGQRNYQRQRKRKTVAHGRTKEIAKDRERGKLLLREGPKKLPKTEKEGGCCTWKDQRNHQRQRKTVPDRVVSSR